MGAKAKKATMKKNLRKASSAAAAAAVASASASASKLPITSKKTQAEDFLPLEGGPAKKLPEKKEPMEDVAKVLYIGRIPHGFYEKEMQEFFQQFGTIKKLRIARNKKTGNSKHYGFLEFESPEVAKIVADCMHNYLLFEHILQVYLIPPERVHPKLWSGATRRYKPLDWTQIERKEHNKERTLEEHRKLVEGILKRDEKRRKKIEEAGIDYVCPEIVGNTQPAPKKIRFV